MNNFWDELLIPGYYDKVLKTGLSKNKGVQSNWHHTTFSKVSKLIPHSNKHLDYACGPGTFVGNYLNVNSVGVDISKKQIEFAKLKYSKNNDFYHTDHFNFRKYKNSFDTVSIIGLLEYLEDDEILKLMEKIYFMLSDGGSVFITTPNYKGLMRFLDWIVNKYSKVDYESQNINKFDYRRIHRIMNNTKFKTIEVKKIINFGVFAGFINITISQRIQNIISSITKDKIGYLLLVILKK